MKLRKWLNSCYTLSLTQLLGVQAKHDGNVVTVRIAEEIPRECSLLCRKYKKMRKVKWMLRRVMS